LMQVIKQMRIVVYGLLFILGTAYQAFAGQDTISRSQPDSIRVYRKPQYAAEKLLDSVARAMAARKQYLADSAALVYIKKPDPARRNLFLDSMMRTYIYKGHGFIDIKLQTRSTLKEGHPRRSRDRWIVVIIAALMFYAAILNRFIGKDIGNVLQSFYSKRVLTQISKEESLLNSWSFIGIYLLFGATFGLFIYQLAAYYDVFYRISGFQLFISLSLLIIILFAVKLLLLKFIGFIFDINRLVSDYMSVLYLTYFNITFVFLPLALCFSLLSAQYIPYLLALSLLLVAVIFIWQFLRSSLNIISGFRFHKFYLFIYLCALEICPVLVLIKALNI
jgi:hypothetical protein